eukprot:70499-Heterocapsa_arctica.AAC.1
MPIARARTCARGDKGSRPGARCRKRQREVRKVSAPKKDGWAGYQPAKEGETSRSRERKSQKEVGRRFWTWTDDGALG